MPPLVLLLFTVAAQNAQNTSTLIVHRAGQDVRLSYHLRQPSSGETPAWMIDLTSWGVSSLSNGLVVGYSADGVNNHLIIKNITMNDDRSGTWYQCVILRSGAVVESGNITILRVAGEYQCRLMVL